MRKIFKMKRCFLIVIINLGLLFFNCFGNSAIQEDVLLSELKNRKLLLFIIDFDSFICFSCLNSFLDFYHGLPYSLYEDMIWGILVYENPKKKESGENYTRIVMKKLKGFIKANNIRFPMVIDHYHAFEDVSREGTSVMLFNQKKKVVKKYVFPLNKKQRDEILRFLKD